MLNAISTLEFNKVLRLVKEYSRLNYTKNYFDNLQPQTNFLEVKNSLELTTEADKLLYVYRVGGVDFFDVDYDCLNIAAKGFVISSSDILQVGALMRSTRLIKSSITNVEFVDIVLLKDICFNIYVDASLEQDIFKKIISPDEIADNASDTLQQIRRQIKSINSKITEKLNGFLSKNSLYVQDSLVTMRNGRYVVPIKAEYKNSVRGLIHDQSASGATVFIEPEPVFYLNNELKTAQSQESAEIERILYDLSVRIGQIADNLKTNIQTAVIIDSYFARATFAYKTKCVKPSVNQDGIIQIKDGRHPLIDSKVVVPLTFDVGTTFNYLLISGANTGGKTVTLKLCGLFVLMTMCGMFLPCASAEISVFEQIFCDIGDRQSIESGLSTFSSHINAIKNITQKANAKTLVLIDELGDGTDSEEGQAIALAVLLYLIELRSKGIVTTHFSYLKEYALSDSRILNAAMEFDFINLLPLYKISMGLPGTSNAILIAKRLGLDLKITDLATSFLSAEKIELDNILNQAQERRLEFEKKLIEIDTLKQNIVKLELQAKQALTELNKEKESIKNISRAEIKKLVAAKTFAAQEFLDKITSIAEKEQVFYSDVITARTLKNKIENQKYIIENVQEDTAKRLPIDPQSLKIGSRVYVITVGKNGKVISLNKHKETAQVIAGNLKLFCKFSDLSQEVESANKPKNSATQKVHKPAVNTTQVPTLEINLIGFTVLDALPECEAFLESAKRNNLNEVKIIHGQGTGKLRSGIQSFLQSHPYVEEYRAGKYGEGESGVTIVTIKN